MVILETLLRFWGLLPSVATKWRYAKSLILTLGILAHQDILQGGTVLWYNDQPVLLADGLTRAGGSNYIVEMLVNDDKGGSQLVGVTGLLEGQFAGFFGSANGEDYVDTPLLPACHTVSLTLRIWDKSTGTNFQSATVKGAETFDQYVAGGCSGGVPPPPIGLANFKALALGNPQFTTNIISYITPQLPPLFPFIPIAWAPKSAPLAVLSLKRQGVLDRSDTVNWSITNGCTLPGVNCLATNGIVTFLPGQTAASLELAIPGGTIHHETVGLAVSLSTVATNLMLTVPRIDVLFYDDTYLQVQLLKDPYRPSYAAIGVQGYDPTKSESFHLEHTDRLAPANWVDVMQISKDIYFWDSYVSPTDLSYTMSFYIPTNLVFGFYRGAR